MTKEKYNQDENIKKEYTEKELEDLRSMGMELLQGYIPKVALSYYVNQEGSDFGKDVQKTVDDFHYIPSMKALGNSGYLLNILLSSRKNGKILSGEISEEGITKKATEDMSGAIGQIKVGDLKDFMELKIPKEYEDKYIFQMITSKDKKENEIGQTVFMSLQNYFVNDGISDAYSQKAKSFPKTLEKILDEESKKIEETN